MIKRVVFYLLMAWCSVAAQAVYAQQTAVNIIPQPDHIADNGQTFTFKPSTVILLNGMPVNNLHFFNNYLKQVANLRLKVYNRAALNLNQIRLRLENKFDLPAEGYHLKVTADSIVIIAGSHSGLFYGLQTLVQATRNKGKKLSVPGMEIIDKPRFNYRGMHLDVSRHMFPVSAIKKWIDMLALYKINTFHWHLTDDQGWRIEIKSMPRLQTVAAYRNETLIGHKKEVPHQFDGKRYGGYYTQQEARDIVQYAKDRHITVVPEIEMPGHATAALAAYPALGCTGGPYATATFWGVFNDVYCAGNEQTFSFLEKVLDEVVEIFPSEYIHIGGDECPKDRWRACPKCQQRMKELQLGNEHELQSYFIKRISNYLAGKKRRIIGWDEILEGGLTPGATVMSWTGEEGGIKAAQQQHDVIMTPEKYVYLDYYQSLYPTEPVAAGGYTPLKKIYGYEPVPAVLNSQEAKFIKGVQANVWTEYMPTVSKAEYMMFPRLLALAEMAWSAKEERSYPKFVNKVRSQLPLLKQFGIKAADNFDEITDTVEISAGGLPMLKLRSTLPGASIHYTTNGTAVTSGSEVYTSPVNIKNTAKVNASLFLNGKRVQRNYQKSFTIHKAVGKPVTLQSVPSGGSYNPGNTNILVNGLFGTDRYNDNQWLGLSGQDFLAVIDLGAVQAVRQIGTHFLNYHWQKMWAPQKVVYAVSTDGKSYRQVFEQSHFTGNGILTMRTSIPLTQARYIKITAKNQGIIPAGEYGAGGKAWLLVDEFIVN